MTGWLESVAGPDYATALMWVILALIALLVLLILVRIIRGFGVGTFVAGGRNRKARLAVMDATAVDSHRRLVLVRRDDIEHLILIGGPTDVVVEQNIRLIAPTRRTVAENEQPAPAPAQPQQPQQPQQSQPGPRQPPAPLAPTPAPAPVARAPQPPSVLAESRAPAPQATPLHTPPPPLVTPDNRPVQRAEVPRIPVSAPSAHAIASPSSRSEIDEALLQELELSLESQPVVPPSPASREPGKTLDDEMSKLLNDLAGQR